MAKIQTQERLIDVKETPDEVRVKLKYCQWIELTEDIIHIDNDKVYDSQRKILLNIDHIIEIYE
jgi:hypothetical protein